MNAKKVLMIVIMVGLALVLLPAFLGKLLAGTKGIKRDKHEEEKKVKILPVDKPYRFGAPLSPAELSELFPVKALVPKAVKSDFEKAYGKESIAERAKSSIEAGLGVVRGGL